MSVRKKLSMAVMLCCLGSLMSLGTANAQSVERIYAANQCRVVSDDINQGVFMHTNESITRRSTLDNFPLVTCPIVRQKVGSSKGAKFWMYGNKPAAGYDADCTITSRRPHNGALVSSGSRSTAVLPIGDFTLARSIAPSSTYGAYSLSCVLDNFPELYSYRIKEF